MPSVSPASEILDTVQTPWIIKMAQGIGGPEGCKIGGLLHAMPRPNGGAS